MSKYYLIATALFFVILAGQFDGAQDARKDYGHDTPMYQGYVVDKDTVMMKWYDGGNHEYNPSFPSVPFLNVWYADYWHTMKHGWIFCYALAIATLSCGYFTGWKQRLLVFVLIAWLGWGFEGESFNASYGIFHRLNPTENIIQMFGDFNPFANSH